MHGRERFGEDLDFRGMGYAKLVEFLKTISSETRGVIADALVF